MPEPCRYYVYLTASNTLIVNIIATVQDVHSCFTSSLAWYVQLLHVVRNCSCASCTFFSPFFYELFISLTVELSHVYIGCWHLNGHVLAFGYRNITDCLLNMQRMCIFFPLCYCKPATIIQSLWSKWLVGCIAVRRLCVTIELSYCAKRTHWFAIWQLITELW